MEYVGIFMVWCVFATIGALLGERKGRRTDGMLLGFFLGPLGCLIAVMMKTDAELKAIYAAMDNPGPSVPSN